MEKIVRMNVFVGVLVYIASIPLLSYAGWEGPWTVVSGNWGAGANQFYSGPSYYEHPFPRQFVVSQSGKIIIADNGNKRIVIYNYDGTLKAIVEKPPELPELDSRSDWPPDINTCSKSENIIISCEYERVTRGIKPLRKCVLDYNGNIKAKVKWGRFFTIENGFVVKNGDIYFFYSPDGKLLKTSKDRPVELGAVKDWYVGEDGHNTIVKYPDKEWRLIGKRVWPEYIRIGDCALYSIGERQIARFDAIGHELGKLTVPEDRHNVISRSPSVEPRYDLVEEYGKPVVAPNGDVYCWKRTPDTYSILRWIWVEGPNAPVVKAASTTNEGLKVSWNPPQGAAKDIEGFEVHRAIEVCGPYQNIAKVDGAQFIYTDRDVSKDIEYFYRVRALQSSGASGFSNTVAGKIEKKRD